MSQTEQEKILDKVKKLLALGESPNEHEASLALARAHGILKQYNLDMSDIKIAKNDEVVDEVYLTQEKISSWKVGIVSNVAKLNYCELYKNNKKDRNGSIETTFNLVGKVHNVIVCRHMAEYVMETIERMGKKFAGYGRNAIESYKAGIADTIMVRIHEMMKKDKVESNESRALVIQETADIAQYFEDLASNGSLTTYKAPQKANNNWDMYAQGRKEGQNVSLNTQIGSSASNKYSIGKR